MTELVIPEAALERHIAILAMTGFGKSYATRGMHEWLLDQGRRVCIIDPTGVHWGIRLQADGKKPSPYPVVIFGGDHGDVEIAPTAGRELGKLIATSNLPCVIDVLQMGVGERTRFFTDFAQALMRYNKLPLQLFIDEAHDFMPQSGYGEKSVDRGKMINAANRLVSAGRARGLRVTLISQRAAKVNKDALTQAETLIALHVQAKRDRMAVKEWVEASADPDEWRAIEKSLAKMPVGQGWVWAPGLDVLEQVTFPRIQTFDSFKAPEEDQAEAAPVALADIDLEQLRGQLGETKGAEGGTKGRPKGSATAAARDDQLRQRNAALTHQVSELQDRLAHCEREIARLVRQIEMAARSLTDAITTTVPRALDTANGTLNSVPSNEARKINTPPRPGPAVGDDPLVAMARSIWPVKLTWAQLCALCGRKARGGHFNTVRKRLVDEGIVWEEGGRVVLSHPPDLGDAIPADVLEQVLPNPARQMFTAIRANPDRMDVQGLGSHLGLQPRGGHWNSGMFILRRNDLIREEGGLLRINPELEGG